MKNSNGKNHGEGERFYYINGDYSRVFFGILGLLDTIDHPIPRGKRCTIYIGSICLDKVVVSRSV